MNPIQGPQLPAFSPPTVPSLNQTTETGQSFKDLLIEGIQQVNGMQQDADQAVQELMTGGDVDPSSVLTSIQKADMSFRMMMQIRNKLLQAYQEIKEIRI